MSSMHQLLKFTLPQKSYTPTEIYTQEMTDKINLLWQDPYLTLSYYHPNWIIASLTEEGSSQLSTILHLEEYFSSCQISVYPLSPRYLTDSETQIPFFKKSVHLPSVSGFCIHYKRHMEDEVSNQGMDEIYRLMNKCHNLKLFETESDDEVDGVILYEMYYRIVKRDQEFILLTSSPSYIESLRRFHREREEQWIIYLIKRYITYVFTMDMGMYLDQYEEATT